jgi:hypothetical protein
MADQPAVPRDPQLPGQQIEAVDDLDPDIEPEPAADQPADTPGLAAEEPGGGDSNPEVGNTLIEPENS